MAKFVCIRDCVWGPTTPPGKASMARRWKVGQVYVGDTPKYMTSDGEEKVHPYFERLGKADHRASIDPEDVYKAQLDEMGIEYDEDTWSYSDYKAAVENEKQRRAEEKEMAEIRKQLDEWGVHHDKRMKLRKLRELQKTGPPPAR